MYEMLPWSIVQSLNVYSVDNKKTIKKSFYPTFRGQYESEKFTENRWLPTVDRRMPLYTAVKPRLQSKFSVYLILVAFS